MSLFPGVGHSILIPIRSRRRAVAPVNTQPAETACELVLAQAGCSLFRDSVDQRIIEEIRTGTARFGETYRGDGKGIIDFQTAVGVAGASLATGTDGYRPRRHAG